LEDLLVQIVKTISFVGGPINFFAIALTINRNNPHITLINIINKINNLCTSITGGRVIGSGAIQDIFRWMRDEIIFKWQVQSVL